MSASRAEQRKTCGVGCSFQIFSNAATVWSMSSPISMLRTGTPTDVSKRRKASAVGLLPITRAAPCHWGIAGTDSSSGNSNIVITKRCVDSSTVSSRS